MSEINEYEYDLVPVFKELVTVDIVRDDIHSMIRARFGERLADFIASKLADIPTEEFFEYISNKTKKEIESTNSSVDIELSDGKDN